MPVHIDVVESFRNGGPGDWVQLVVGASLLFSAARYGRSLIILDVGGLRQREANVGFGIQCLRSRGRGLVFELSFRCVSQL